MNEPRQEILEGEVTKIAPYGAFIKLADGRFGMVHISEIAYEYVNTVEDALKIGDKVKVVLLQSQQDKLNFSIKRAQKLVTKSPLNKEKNNNTDGVKNIRQNKPSQFKEQNGQSAAAKFEDMLNKFKQTSDEKLSSLKKVVNTRRGTNRKNFSGRK